MSNALYIALTGLQSNSEAISTTGNNLANLNTNGFKESEVDFKNLFSQSYGTGTGIQVGLGTSIPRSNQVFTQGSIQSSESPLSAAIQGSGFFVVHSPNGQTLYTRDGNFSLNAKGVLQTQTGEDVQGWTATSSGINTVGTPSSITFPTGEVLPPSATQNFTLKANLNSQGVAGTSTGTFSDPIQVVDSLGNTHNLTVSFTKSSSTANTWTYDVTIPAGDLSGGTAGQQQSLLSSPGTMTFNSDGTMSNAGGTAPLAIGISGLADGAADMTINWNQFDSDGKGNFTQYAEASNPSFSSQDGTQPSELSSVAITNGGQVVATYSNGQVKVQAQLAMASVENPNSLQNVGDNNFALSSDTAIPAIGIPQTGNRGQILGSSLEASNVDIATEFTHLITFQSGYQASSRVITTENTLQQDLFNLIH